MPDPLSDEQIAELEADVALAEGDDMPIVAVEVTRARALLSAAKERKRLREAAQAAEQAMLSVAYALRDDPDHAHNVVRLQNKARDLRRAALEVSDGE